MNVFFAESFFQSDAFAVILVVGIAILAVAMTLTVVKVINIERNVARNRCKIVGQIDINPEDVANPHLVIAVANRTLHHINIVSCGIFYDKKMINFIESIRINNELTPRDKVFIPTNDSIEVRIPIAKVRELIETGKRITSIKVYAQDSLNNVTKANAVGVKKYIVVQKKKELAALKAAAMGMPIKAPEEVAEPELPKEPDEEKKVSIEEPVVAEEIKANEKED